MAQRMFFADDVRGDNSGEGNIINPVEYSGSGHWIRGSLYMPLSTFQENFADCEMVMQIYSDAECEVAFGYGFLGSYKDGYTITKYVTLHEGYNEFRMDFSDEVFKNLTVEESTTRFWFHFLFGNWNQVHQPSTGVYHFTFSGYKKAHGESIVAPEAVPESAFAGSMLSVPY